MAKEKPVNVEKLKLSLKLVDATRNLGNISPWEFRNNNQLVEKWYILSPEVVRLPASKTALSFLL